MALQISTTTTTAVNPSYNASNISTCSNAEVTVAKLAYFVFMVFILLVSLFGNSVVVFAVLMSKRLTDRSTFYFLSSLACSDMVIATFTVPFRIFMVLQGKGNAKCLSATMCYIFYLMNTFGNMASILNLFLVSTDRFVAVHMPYRYPSLLSKGRAKQIICLAWITAACWALLGTVRWAPTSPGKPLFVDICLQDNVNYHVASFGFYAVVLLAMSVQYVDIMQVVLRQIRLIEQNTPQYQSSPDFHRSPAENRRLSIDMVTSTDQSYTPYLKQKSRWPLQLKSRLRREIKATKTIVLVFLAFCLCWLPGLIFTIIHFCDEKFFFKLDPTTSAILYFTFVDIFPTVSTMVNPIIYSFSNAQFRSSVEEVWRKLMKKAPRRLNMCSTSHGARVSSSTTSSTMSSRGLSIDENVRPVNV